TRCLSDWSSDVCSSDLAPALSERLASLPLVLGYYPLLPLAAPRLGHILARHLDQAAGPIDLVHNVRSGREPLSLASLELARRRRSEEHTSELQSLRHLV